MKDTDRIIFLDIRIPFFSVAQQRDFMLHIYASFPAQCIFFATYNGTHNMKC